jgi:hypothetical protein
MIIICAAYGVAVIIFALVYFGIYRPLYSESFPGEIIDVIPAFSTVGLVELERWVSDEMSSLMVQRLTPREQRVARRRRRQIIAERLAPVEANARLILAFTRQQTRVIRSKPPGPRSERDRLMEQLFERSQYCCLLLTFARASRILMPWDTGRLIQFHRGIVVKEVRELLLMFMKLSATYGEHCRENLLAALDVWELAEENQQG